MLFHISVRIKKVEKNEISQWSKIFSKDNNLNRLFIIIYENEG